MWVAAASASALSLGGSRGSVVLGGPIDLAFEIQPDAGSDLASSCVAARILAGDTPIADGRIRLTPIPAAPGRSPAMRVQAGVAIDEPVVSVTLSAGCAGKVTRTYTFLSEFPVATGAANAPVDVRRLPLAVLPPAPAPVPAPAPSPATGAASTGGEGARNAGASAPAARSTASDSARPAAAGAGSAPAVRRDAPPPKVERKRTARPAPEPARSRLVIEPLDLWIDSPVPLQASPLLGALPAESASAQRSEAAALWKALNTPPEDVLRDQSRLAEAETALAQAKAQTGESRVAAAQLQQQLEQAESERFPAWMVYALGGLLALALAAVAGMALRLRRRSEQAEKAWRDSVAVVAGDSLPRQEPSVAPSTAPIGVHSWAGSEDAPVSELTEYEPSELPADSKGARLVASAPAPVELVGHPTVPTVQHIVNPEELFDVQQQAEFFVSVGEHHQAIEVLRRHIAEHPTTSPVAALELLRLYHTLSRVDDFTQLRDQFMQSFNAEVPNFIGFHRPGRNLEYYTEALADIEAEWTSPAVLMLLDGLLFRREGEPQPVDRFDLAAYDDLLLLLTIVQTTPASARGAPPPRQRTTPLMPPPDVPIPKARSAQGPGGARPPARDAVGLDFDFDDLLDTPAATPAAAKAGGAAGAPGDIGRTPLDLDLTEPAPLDFEQVPLVPPPGETPKKSSGDDVGFGMHNDLMELRLELEPGQQPPKKP